MQGIILYNSLEKSIVFSCVVLILVSCNQISKDEMILPGDDMESTLSRNKKYKFSSDKNVSVKRNDIIWFNYIEKAYDIKSSKVLRLVGLPGDTLLVKGGKIFIDGQLFKMPKTSKEAYYVKVKTNIPAKLENYFIRQISQSEYLVYLDAFESKDFMKLSFIDSISLRIVDKASKEMEIISNGQFKYFNSYNLGPVVLPKKGDLITEDILRLIPNYLDGNEIGQKLTEEFYYLVADNRYYGTDSRYIGLVPKSAFLGKLVFEDGF